MSTASQPEDALARYRPWLMAAALHNLIWGTSTVLFPEWWFRLIDAPLPNYLPLWQGIGMMVLVYAPAYWWASRDPVRHAPFVLIGMLGKLLGPLGYVMSAAQGTLPLAFGWAIIVNDLLWWPIFFSYLRASATHLGGWRILLMNDVRSKLPTTSPG
jgi:small multidrug resistance pump